MTEKEIWKDVPGYEGCYQVSNLGRVRSLDREVTYTDGRVFSYKGKIINGTNSNGYRNAGLTINKKVRTFTFSQLVAMAFLDHVPNGHKLVVDHINGDKSDNRATNLRIVTHRDNSSTCFRVNDDSFSSKHIGVSWNKTNSKWLSTIGYNKVCIHLGYFDNELEASNAYQSALSKIKDDSFNPKDYKPKYSSKHRGVSFHKGISKWVAQTTFNGKYKHIGSYKTEIEAHEAYKQFKQTRHENKIKN